MALKEVLFNNPDAPDFKRAARMSDEQINITMKIQEMMYAEVRRVLERLGVKIKRDDIWATIENRMIKLKISVMHSFDPKTHGRAEDKGGWFIKKDDVLVARIPHPYLVGRDFYFPPTEYPTIHTSDDPV